eukprot:144673-Pleurochrysis_carterae.AAC.1
MKGSNVRRPSASGGSRSDRTSAKWQSSHSCLAHRRPAHRRPKVACSSGTPSSHSCLAPIATAAPKAATLRRIDRS